MEAARITNLWEPLQSRNRANGGLGGESRGKEKNIDDREMHSAVIFRA